jgi:hypothetical protein
MMMCVRFDCTGSDPERIILGIIDSYSYRRATKLTLVPTSNQTPPRPSSLLLV